MQIKIKATGIILNPDIEKYLEKRLESLGKITDFSNSAVLAEVELGRTTSHHQSGDIFRAELNLTMDGRHFRTEAEKDDLNSAIDEMKDEMADALRSFKGKKISLFRRGGARIKQLLRKFYR